MRENPKGIVKDQRSQDKCEIFWRTTQRPDIVKQLINEILWKTTNKQRNHLNRCIFGYFFFIVMLYVFGALCWMYSLFYTFDAINGLVISYRSFLFFKLFGCCCSDICATPFIHISGRFSEALKYKYFIFQNKCLTNYKLFLWPQIDNCNMWLIKCKLIVL